MLGCQFADAIEIGRFDISIYSFDLWYGAIHVDAADQYVKTHSSVSRPSGGVKCHGCIAAECALRFIPLDDRSRMNQGGLFRMRNGYLASQPLARVRLCEVDPAGPRRCDCMNPDLRAEVTGGLHKAGPEKSRSSSDHYISHRSLKGVRSC